jgi:nucleoid DNA-binding protein
MSRQSQVNYAELNAKKKFCNNDLIHEVADKLNVGESMVKAIVDSQSKFTAYTIKSGTMDSIAIVYLGKFKVNPKQVQKMMSKSMKT